MLQRPDHTAQDGKGTKHSPYTAALLEATTKPDLRLGDVFDDVAVRVREATGGLQRPTYEVPD
jgi:uncharacterized caspase-like protein